MLSSNVLVFLAPMLFDGFTALEVIAPFSNDMWNLQDTNGVTWTSVSTDPLTFDIVLVNNNPECAPTGMRQFLKGNVLRADGRFDISNIAPVMPCGGYKINLVAAGAAHGESYANTDRILAQSQPFTIISAVPPFVSGQLSQSPAAVQSSAAHLAAQAHSHWAPPLIAVLPWSQPSPAVVQPTVAPAPALMAPRPIKVHPAPALLAPSLAAEAPRNLSVTQPSAHNAPQIPSATLAQAQSMTGESTSAKVHDKTHSSLAAHSHANNVTASMASTPLAIVKNGTGESASVKAQAKLHASSAGHSPMKNEPASLAPTSLPTAKNMTHESISVKEHAKSHAISAAHLSLKNETESSAPPSVAAVKSMSGETASVKTLVKPQASLAAHSPAKNQTANLASHSPAENGAASGENEEDSDSKVDSSLNATEIHGLSPSEEAVSPSFPAPEVTLFQTGGKVNSTSVVANSSDVDTSKVPSYNGPQSSAFADATTGGFGSHDHPYKSKVGAAGNAGVLAFRATFFLPTIIAALVLPASFLCLA